MAKAKHPLETSPDLYTIQQCCLCYGGNSYVGPMKTALECHLSILKSKHPVLDTAPDLLKECKYLVSILEVYLSTAYQWSGSNYLNNAKATIAKAEKEITA